MTPAEPANLPHAARGFLSSAQLRWLGDRALVSADYALAKYHPQLFADLKIACPDSVAHASPKRQAEYLAGRTMAQLAQRCLNFPTDPVHIAPSRAPIWPKGQAGSISHARGRCACYLAPQSAGDPGLDTEAIANPQAMAAIRKRVFHGQDETFASRSGLPDTTAASLIFSAKETLFKALYPTVRRHFGFDCAELTTPPNSNQLTLRLTTDLHPTLPKSSRSQIHYETDQTHVLTHLIHRP